MGQEVTPKQLGDVMLAMGVGVFLLFALGGMVYSKRGDKQLDELVERKESGESNDTLLPDVMGEVRRTVWGTLLVAIGVVLAFVIMGLGS